MRSIQPPKHPPTFFVGALLAIWLTTSETASAVDLSGHWSGYWQSCTTGHKGPLNAKFCRLSDNCYKVSFTGRFFVVFPFRYSVTLKVVREENGCVTLAGSHYLGRLFGTFTYRVTASATYFKSNYYSAKDDGIFVLRRYGGCGR